MIFLARGRARVPEVLRRAASEWNEAEVDAEHNLLRYRHLVEYSPGLICTHTVDGKLLSVNPAAARSLGYAPEQMVGRSLGDFVDADTRLLMNLYLDRITKNGRDESFIPVLTKNGDRRIWQCNSVIFKDVGDPYVIGYAQDVTELFRARHELKRLVVTDELTGLSNRRGFFTLAEHAIKTAKREGKSCLLICADVDGLKSINDSLGHPAGSDLLVDVGQILRKVFRESDVIARIGGDEFAILARDNDLSTESVILSRLKSQIDAFNKSAGRKYTIAVSAGVACYSAENRLTIQELLSEADEKLVDQKNRNRGAFKLEIA